MSYSERFAPEGMPLSEAEAAELSRDLLAGLGETGRPAPALPCIPLPVANPDALRLYPEHFAIVLIVALSALMAAAALMS